jgi:hypothetical protein
MGSLSVILNIFTIVLVGMFFYITFVAFTSRVDKNETWLQTFKRVLSGESEVTPDMSHPPPVAFIGQDWSESPCNDSPFGKGIPSIDLNNTDRQEGLQEFMDASSSIKYGTESMASKQQRAAFSSMSLAQQREITSRFTDGFVKTIEE